LGLLAGLAGLGFLGFRGEASAPAKAKLAEARQRRMERLRAAGITAEKLQAFVTRYRKVDRERILAQGWMGAMAPKQGGAMISGAHRSEAGERVLQEAKDMLFALLFGDAECGVVLERTERELLTLTAPRAKVQVLEFMQAATEFSGSGTWQDPANVANDSRADNVIIEVEYGETADELVGHGIVTALRLINLLEVNEQVLYARMTNVEQSTLVD
jgi:hypothetical protein